MSKAKQNITDLLAAIHRQAPTAPDGPTTPVSDSSEVSVPAKSPQGKPVQFWLFEEDRKLIREYAAWLAGQGIRTTDSMVIRAVLRMAKTGPALLDAYRLTAERSRGRSGPASIETMES